MRPALLSVFLFACATPQSTQMVEVATPMTNAAPEVREVQNANVTVRVIDYKGGDVTPAGRQRRLPGGTANLYTLPPAGFHRVNVRFDVSSIHQGEMVQVDFTPALQRVGGGTIAMPPIALKYF
jgi:hypothetical protein